ncbi:hypothetical protein OSB04_018991 [Centaurea solstitialis]|uniref:Uncharacterized protein n=1 Tax=Centaurea solstitialis TaxID=347529 RepID=A0AA38SQ06_9ASTR|nr:hypothetical protein OSB04_018991 [Centaurea solstitialis]
MYRYFRVKNDSTTLNSINTSNLVTQTNRRTGRVSRSVAKKYNKNRVVYNNNKKSPPPLPLLLPSLPHAGNKSALPTVNEDNNSIAVKKNITESQGCGIKSWDLEKERENQDSGPDEYGLQDGELMDFCKLLESGGTMDLNGFLSLHDEKQPENVVFESAKNGEIEDEILSLNASQAMGACSNGELMDDDKMLWQWEEDDLEQVQWVLGDYVSSVESGKKGEIEDGILSFKSSEAMGFCPNEDSMEFEVEKDDMMLWLWEDDDDIKVVL